MSLPFDYDAELVRYQARLWAALEVGPDDDVLDIGCGTGLTTREAAKAAVAGSALGVEISAEKVATARQVSEQEGLPNVWYEHADAQTYDFPAEGFSLGFSRFGTMFFDEPDVAFANIARALKPGARLVQLVWQGQKQQEWVSVVRDALASGSAAPARSAAFSLAEPEVAERLLVDAGFEEVRVVEVREPVYYGPDPKAACDAIRSLQLGQDLLEGLDEAQTAQAYQRLLDVLAARQRTDGVWFDSRAWIITAVKPSA